MLPDNVCGGKIIKKRDIWPRSKASRANVKFYRQSLSQGYYQLTYQQARKGLLIS